MRKNLWLLLIIFIFAGCNPATESGAPPKDIWSDITSWDQVDGTWVGTQNKSMPLVDAIEMIALLGIAFDTEKLNEIEPFIKDINVDIAAEMTMSIDTDVQTVSNAAKTTVTFSGGNTPLLWMMKDLYITPENIPPGVSFDDKNHAITMDVEEPPTPITEEYLAQFQINQNGTRLKATTEYAGFEEVIFIRVN